MIDISDSILRLRDEGHPGLEELESFMADRLPRPRALAVVRHLLAGCPECRKVTARLWCLSKRPLLNLEVH
jgi:hypothetical protein